MIQVLKDGDLQLRKFKCKFCGCEFIADMIEYDFVTLDYFHINCPQCYKGFEQKAQLYFIKEK